MNSIPGREPRPDRSRYQSTQRNPQRGCYLALTFGTLLSSQGADAQKLDPFGFSSLATFPTVRRSRRCSPAWVLRGPGGPRRRNRDEGTRTAEGSAGGGPRAPPLEAQATPAGRNCTLT